MKNVILFLKGLIIGIGKIIPGVSGSMLAITMGLYEKGINSISTFWKKESFLFLINVGSGILIAIIFGSRLILHFLNTYPLYMLSLFTGLIFSNLFQINKKINFRDKKIIISFIIVILLYLLMINKQNNIYQFSFSYHTFFFFIIVGMIESFTMIVPGISGTAVMMMMGVYNFIMNIFSNIFNFNHLIFHLFVLSPFFIGIIIGSLFITKLIHYFLKKYNTLSTYFILGFILSSILFLIKLLFPYITSIYNFLIAVILFILGFFLAYQLRE